LNHGDLVMEINAELPRDSVVLPEARRRNKVVCRDNAP
jgi:hypothetical protein